MRFAISREQMGGWAGVRLDRWVAARAMTRDTQP